MAHTPRFRLPLLLVLLLAAVTLTESSCTSGPPADLIPNASWGTFCNNSDNNERCTVDCVPGYIAHPSFPRAKCVNGGWIKDSGGCVAGSPCDASNLPSSNASFSWPAGCTGSLAHDSVCTAQCAAGYVSEPGTSLSRRCFNGTWVSLGQAGCRPAGCNTPPLPSLANHANWTHCGTSNHAELCTGGCLIGYMAHPTHGPPKALCTAGAWSLSAGECVVATCAASSLPSSDGSFSWPSSCTGSLAHNTECIAQCAAGHIPESGTRLARRCDSGSWVITGAAGCRPADCETPPPQSLDSHANWTRCGGRSDHNETCTGGCLIGYMAHPTHGPPKALCTAGAWSLSAGECVAATCAASSLPRSDETFSWPNSCTGSLAHNTECTAQCNTGYVPESGTRLARRCDSGSWVSVGEAGCRPAGCSSSPPSNLATHANWTLCDRADHCQTCSATCSTGYMADQDSDSPRALCEKGEWRLEAGACVAIPCSDQPLHSLAPNAAWSCTLPAAVSANCTASCVQSTADTRLGAPVARCDLGGQWSKVSGACIRSLGPQGCPTPPPANLADNTVWRSSCVSANHGQQCTGTCSTDATPDAATGRPVAMCADGFWTLLGGACVGSCRLTFTKARRGRLRASQAPTISQLCPGATAFAISFPYTAQGVQGLRFTATAASTSPTSPTKDGNLQCTVDGDTGGTATVSCATVTGHPLPTGTNYTVSITANYRCNNMAARSTSSAEIRVPTAVQVSLLRQGPSRLSVCQHKGAPFSVKFEQGYKVVADQAAKQADPTPENFVLTVTSDVTGVTCVTETKEGTANSTVVDGTLVTTGTAVITCAGSVRPGRSFGITTSLVAAQTATCRAARTTLKQRVFVPCCGEGVSYARPTKGGAINCFQHFWPNTTSCDIDATTLHGVYSQGPGTTTLTWYDTAAARCAGLADVGYVTMACDDSNDRQASFTIESRSLQRGSMQYVMMTCDKPPKAQPGGCAGSIPWTRVSVDKPAGASGGKVAFNASLPQGSSCACNNAFWAVHESATYVGLPVRLCMK